MDRMLFPVLVVLLGWDMATCKETSLQDSDTCQNNAMAPTVSAATSASPGGVPVCGDRAITIDNEGDLQCCVPSAADKQCSKVGTSSARCAEGVVTGIHDSCHGECYNSYHHSQHLGLNAHFPCPDQSVQGGGLVWIRGAYALQAGLQSTIVVPWLQV